MKKSTLIVLLITACIASILFLAACGEENNQNVTPIQLNTPRSLSVNGSMLSWQNVSNASSYSIQVDNEIPIANITANSYSLTNLTTPHSYSVKVKAIGDGINYLDSDWSDVTIYTVQKTVITVKQPNFFGTLSYGDELPQISTQTPGGTVKLNDGQILKTGINLYEWTFIPFDINNYEWVNTTGTISLMVSKKIEIVEQPTFHGMLYYGDELPQITTPTKGGIIKLNEGQTLSVGTNNYGWTFTPTDTDNYEYFNTSGIISLIVNKKAMSVIEPTFKGTLTYGDSLPTIATETKEGTIELNSDQKLITGTNHYIWTFTPLDTDNYEWSNISGTISLTVYQGTVTVAQPTFDGFLTYGDDLPAITTTTTSGTVRLDAGQTLTAGTKSYNWTFTLTDNVNYICLNAVGTISLTVSKKSATVINPTFSGELTYGDDLPGLTTATTGGTLKLDADQILTAGTKSYKWTFTPIDSDNYEWSNTTGTISLTVAKKYILVTQPTFSGTLIYGDALPVITTVTEGGTIALKKGQILIAGIKNYEWTFTPGDEDNYLVTTGTISLTVLKRNINVASPEYIGETLVYGDSLPTITTTTTGGTIALILGQHLIAGTNDYNWKFIPDDLDNNNIIEGTISLTVMKAAQAILRAVSFIAIMTAKTSVKLIDLREAYNSYEYSLDDTQWQSSDIFNDLTIDSTYTFYIRLKETANYFASGNIILQRKATIEATDFFTYKTTNGSSIEITGLTDLGKKETAIEIPSLIGNLLIETIGENAFSNNTVIKSITITDYIYSIGINAFSGCNNLTDIKLDSVRIIGDGAFSNCIRLKNINFGSDLITIGNAAFYACTGLGSVVIPDKVTNIGISSFEECSNLKKVILSKSVTTIGNSAFYFCNSLESITIPSNVTTIGRTVFPKYTSLAIYTEAASKPSGWDDIWNFHNAPVIWGCTLSTDKTYVVSYVKTAVTLNTFHAGPSRAGYTLSGWSLSQGSTTVAYTTQTVNNATIGTRLYAVWKL